jgi:hypothetical protein
VEPVPDRTGVAAEEVDDRPVVPRQGLRLAPLPLRQGLLADPEPCGEVALPEAHVEPAAPKVITGVFECTPAPPWQDARPGTAQPKWQKGNATVQVRLARASPARLPLHANGDCTTLREGERTSIR